MKKIFCALFLLSAVICTWAHPFDYFGSPHLFCDSMTVRYPLLFEPYPPKSELPYNISISEKSISPGEETDINIFGNYFKGFFVQVRKEDKAVGSFITTPEHAEYQTMTCHNSADSAAFKTDDIVKKLVTLRWKAPQDKGELHVYVTMVKKFQKIWTKIDVGTIIVE